MARSSNIVIVPTDEPHIAQLPKPQASCLAQFCKGLSYDAIAAVLEIPIGTVKSRINRARNTIVKLRAKAAVEGQASTEAAA